MAVKNYLISLCWSKKKYLLQYLHSIVFDLKIKIQLSFGLLERLISFKRLGERILFSADAFCSITPPVSKQAMHHDNRWQPGAAKHPGEGRTEGSEIILERIEN